MSDSNFCLIVANGDVDDYEWLATLAKRAAYIIGADGGCNHLFACGIHPDVAIGDFDSVSAETMAWLKSAAVPLTTHPAKKDETDIELALAVALPRSSSIYIAAAMGGRIDQSLANALLLGREDLVDRDLRIVQPFETVRACANEVTLSAEIGDTLSLIALDQNTIVRTTEGLQWPLENSHLAFGYSRGVSNRITSSKVSISLSSGMVLLTISSQTWMR